MEEVLAENGDRCSQPIGEPVISRGGFQITYEPGNVDQLPSSALHQESQDIEAKEQQLSQEASEDLYNPQFLTLDPLFDGI